MESYSYVIFCDLLLALSRMFAGFILLQRDSALDSFLLLSNCPFIFNVLIDLVAFASAICFLFCICILFYLSLYSSFTACFCIGGCFII